MLGCWVVHAWFALCLLLLNENYVEMGLEAVATDVPLEGILDGVGALEELFASLVLLGARVGVQVFVKEFPHVVGKAQDLEVLGVSKEKTTQLASHESTFCL